jgi:EAL domain-containing protein (putative c-di-GMP-specific phosphodiesterase class I)
MLHQKPALRVSGTLRYRSHRQKRVTGKIAVMTQALDAIATELRGLFPGVRVLTLSVHDTTGEPLWMSEGVLGPDEHSLALDALDVFQLEPARRCFERPHGDTSIGMVFPSREPAGELRGLAVLIADTRHLGGSAQERALQPALQSLMRRLAVHLRSRAAATEENTIAALMDPTGEIAASGGTVVALAADPRFAELTLYVQQMLRLKTSGRTRRFEVLLRSRRGGAEERAPMQLLKEADDPATRGALDRHVVSQLIQWFAQNRDALDSEPASFSVNLSIGALADPEFLDWVARLLHATDVNPRMLAFELREQVCRDHAADVQRFVAQCEELKCQVVIDDFTLHSDVLPLLRSPAVRLVKIDAHLTTAAMKDKLSQAIVVAISQASKVLGAHCVAKRIESTMARQWLAAIGVDFAQGFLLEGLMPLASLSGDRRTATGSKVS